MAVEDVPGNGLVLKEIVDKAGALGALVLFSPLFLILAILIKRDGGPVFYGQTRIGQHGKPFKCWKFRSMAVDADKILQNILTENPEAREEWARDFKLKNDPRITPVGHFLRKTSLDEIPQIFNVLCGEMSLVGPRPIVEAEKAYYGDVLKYYLAMKPGITGLWQISGRNDTTYERRVSLDRQYAQQRSFFKDMEILLKTVFVVISRKGAY